MGVVAQMRGAPVACAAGRVMPACGTGMDAGTGVGVGGTGPVCRLRQAAGLLPATSRDPHIADDCCNAARIRRFLLRYETVCASCVILR